MGQCRHPASAKQFVTGQYDQGKIRQRPDAFLEVV